MKIGIQKKFILVFSILLIIAFGRFTLLSQSENNVSEQMEWVHHTNYVLQKSEALLGSLRDAETGQRGFLLTEKNEYLEPFNQGFDNSRKIFDELKELTNDNSQQQVRLGELNVYIKQKFDELNLTIELIRKNKKDKAFAIVNSKMGKVAMDTIRIKLNEFVEIEKRLLVERQAVFEKTQEQVGSIYVGEVIFLVVFLLVIAYMIKKQVVNPVVSLTSVAERMAKGEDINNIPIIHNNDEIGQLVSTFSFMNLKIKSAIDELTEAKTKSEKNENKLSEIIWSSNVGTWQWDIATDEMKLNERWAEMHGYSLSELEPFYFNDVMKMVFLDDMEAAVEEKENLFSGKINFYHLELRRYTKNNELIWVSERARVTERNSDGTISRISGATTNVTKRKQADIAKNDFISVMSHELRTPLTSIKGSLSLIKSGVVGQVDKSVQSMIEVAFNNSERLILLINDILDIEKIESGKMSFEMKPIDVNALMNDAIEANAGYGEQCEVTFTKSDVTDEILVKGDHVRLMQVYSNIMSNAAKFSPKNGEVQLSVLYDDDMAYFNIKDFGDGIPKEFQGDIFNKFTQADSSDTRAVSGTGLGLSIAKEIVEKHGGEISFVSEIGKGTTFIFSIPRS